MTVSFLSPHRSVALTTSSFGRRSFLPLRRDALWEIKTGVVRTLTILEDGTSITMGLWGPGDVVGRVLSNAEPYQIECLTSVEAKIIPEPRWHEATQAMILHIQRAGELMEILHCRQADSSLLRLFNWLAQRFGQAIEQGKLIDLRLTHQDIAELMGVSRVTVTRLLGEFERQGIIQRRERQFIVTNDQTQFWHYEI